MVMAIKDPEKRREYARARYQANREKVLEETRLRRAPGSPGREQHNASSRRWYWANRERAAEISRKWREENPDKVRENMRRWRAAGGSPHRHRLEATDMLWREQGGRCYLCKQEIPREDAVLEHDHRCCPRLKFCDLCVRGVACQRCNHVVGHAGDDPDRLELIARNLRAKLAEVDERLAAKPEQLTLEESSVG
jgi:Recombination endonuclease VII